MIPGNQPMQVSEQTIEAVANPEVRWTRAIANTGGGGGASSGSAGGAGVSDIRSGTVRLAPQEGHSIGRPLSVTSQTMC